MKKIFLTLALAALSLGIKAQSIIDVATYHLVEGSTFHYAHNFSELSNVYFNLPFADNFLITGTYLQFSLDYETFVWQFVRKAGMTVSDVSPYSNNQYIDFYIMEELGGRTYPMGAYYDYTVDENGNIIGYNINYGLSSSSDFDSFGGIARTHILRVYFYR